VDVLGLVVAVVVLAASAHENTAGIALLERVAAQASTVRKALVDQGFKNSVITYGATLGIDVEIVERNPADKGFVPAETLGGADLRHPVLSPAAGPRLRAPAQQLGIARVLGDDRRDGPAADRHASWWTASPTWNACMPQAGVCGSATPPSAASLRAGLSWSTRRARPSAFTRRQ
jgi:hypothetical protein